MWKRLALLFVFMLFLGTPVLALNANDLRNNLVKTRFSAVAASKYFVDGLPLGGHVKSENLTHQEYQCRPSDKFSGFIWCHEEHTTSDNRVMRSHSILQSQDGTAYYVNSYFQPAFFDPNHIQNEIDRMSSQFGQQARIIQMSQREGLPSAVMAIWGAIQLEPLKPDEISVVASGGSPPGIWSAFLAMKNVPQKQAFQFIGWLVVQDFCGWRPSIRPEEGCYSIWRLTIQRLNPLVNAPNSALFGTNEGHFNASLLNTRITIAISVIA